MSPAQRGAVLDLPADLADIERIYTLGPDDLAEVARRRRGANRIGHAVQLCYLCHPGRRLLPGEAVPEAILALLVDQIGCVADDFAARTRLAERGWPERIRSKKLNLLLGEGERRPWHRSHRRLYK